ncbi:MAG: serine hydrolase [Gammaproteobacteria bacterium]|nr:serine hydrolase [Gammaproteobacteria bacterium]
MRGRNWLLTTTLLCCVLTAGSEARTLDEQHLAALLEEARAEMKMPGLRAAVRLPDGRIVRAATGLADKEAGTPLDNDIAMPGGSTGKTFVAALTMLLVEDGTLSLDDPASKWLGDLSWYTRLPNPADIRVRHLLSHSAGISDYPGTFRYNLHSVWRAIRRGGIRFTPEELIGFATGKKPLNPPGEGYRYTDVGYLVLGRLIEAATGRSYYDLLTERILEPHGFEDIVLQDRSVLPVTPGYTMGARNLRDDGTMKIDPSSEWTGGGLASTPTDLVRFHAALAAGEIVRPESLEQMLEGGWHNPATPGEHYGFGLFVHDHGTAWSHGGLWPGYRTHVTHNTRAATTIAVQTNRDGRIDMGAVVARIARALAP